MLHGSELTNYFNKEVLKEIRLEGTGPLFRTLCEAFPIRKIRNFKHHHAALQVLAKLPELLAKREVDSKVRKQVLEYLEAMGILVEEYEKENFSREAEKISGTDVLKFLMEQHGLKQADLVQELGSQSVTSEILAGKRKLNQKQIAALAKRFNASPAAFFPI